MAKRRKSMLVSDPARGTKPKTQKMRVAMNVLPGAGEIQKVYMDALTGKRGPIFNTRSSVPRSERRATDSTLKPSKASTRMKMAAHAKRKAARAKSRKGK